MFYFLEIPDVSYLPWEFGEEGWKWERRRKVVKRVAHPHPLAVLAREGLDWVPNPANATAWVHQSIASNHQQAPTRSGGGRMGLIVP